jgi:deoxyribodipyrimidine photo-lyase
MHLPAKPLPPKPPHTAMHSFEPTLQSAHARLAAVQPAAYARTRNALDGAVTRLSPYLTHGLLSLREVFDAVNARHPLDAQHKFVFELGWRAYYRHVWAHLGDGIHQSLHAGLLPDDAYQTEMPTDVLEARTGIPAIDLAVRALYETGYVHNHARMWLASYLVHLRKVHWHAGAQWMLGHLLDGDVASNHLSWQWVAGTSSTKPYLFNADNVAKYAPAQWHSTGTVIDTSYEEMDRIARSAAPVRPYHGRALQGMQTPSVSTTPPPGTWSAPDSTLVTDRDVWLAHPWSLGAPPQKFQTHGLVVGVGVAEAHMAQPWSAQRWHFVTQGLQAHTTHLWWGDTAHLAEALRTARSVAWQPDPHLHAALPNLQEQLPAPLFEAVRAYCPSFAQWWRKTKIAE